LILGAVNIRNMLRSNAV